MNLYLEKLLNFFPSTALKKPEPLFSPLFIDGELLRQQYGEWLRNYQARVREAAETRRRPPRDKTWGDYFALALSE